MRPHTQNPRYQIDEVENSEGEELDSEEWELSEDSCDRDFVVDDSEVEEEDDDDSDY